jgi:hypothetical protein
MNGECRFDVSFVTFHRPSLRFERASDGKVRTHLKIGLRTGTLRVTSRSSPSSKNGLF